jgi:hypothetical protein
MLAIFFVLFRALESRPQQRGRTLKTIRFRQRTLILWLHQSQAIETQFHLKKEQIMLEQSTLNRVLNRMGARELSPEEVQYVAGAATGCHGTSLHKNGPIVDVLCDPS